MRFANLLPRRLQYTIHNIVGHPVMEICYILGKGTLGDKVHDWTLPRSQNFDDSGLHHESNRPC